MADSAPIGSGGVPRFRVNGFAGLKYFLRWIRNPVSLEGASNVPKMKMALGGPEFHARVEEMRADPVGRRILADRPDIGLVLAEDALADMPEGSLGRIYHAHANVEGAVPGYLLAGQLYRGPEYDALDWDEDMKFLLWRLNNVHDLIHQLCGYGTDLSGESLTISYTLGLEAMDVAKARRMATFWANLSWLLNRPSIGYERYKRYSMEAFERGAATCARQPLHNIYFEELLPVQVEKVRERLGVPPVQEAFDSAAWKLSNLGEKIARGYRKEEESDNGRLAYVDHLVRAGIPVKTLVNLRDSALEDLLERAANGARSEELRALAGVP